MLTEQSTLFIIICKTIFLFWLYKKSSIQKNIRWHITVTLCYDIATDILMFLFVLPAFLRPWWFNIFVGFGLILFLAKTHSIRNICLIITKTMPKYSKFYFFCSFFMGTTRLIWNIILFVANSFTRDVLIIRHPLYIYITRFCITIYPIILIAPVLYIFKKKLQNDSFPRPLRECFYNFFYFGLLPKIIADMFQTSTFQFIKNLILDTPLPNTLSPLATQVASLFSFLYIYFAYKMLNNIEYYQKKENLIINEFEKITITISNKSFDGKKNLPTLEKELIYTIKEDLSDLVNVSKDAISIILLDKYDTSHLYSEKENFLIYTLKNNEDIKKIFEKYETISREDMEAMIYFHDDFDAKLILSFLKENNIFLISTWRIYSEITGAIIINYNPLINPTFSARKILKKVASCSNGLKIFYKNQSLNNVKEIDIFREAKNQEHIKRITVSQAESLSEIIRTMIDCKIISFSLKRNKIIFSNEIDTFISCKDEADKIIQNASILLQETDGFKKVIEKKMTVINDKTYIFSAYPKTKNSLQPYGFIQIFSKNLSHYSIHETSASYAFLQFTHIGKVLNSIISSNHPSVIRYKINLISMILDPAPLLLPLPTQYAQFVLKIIAFLENKKLELFSCSQNFNEKDFFDHYVMKNETETTQYINTLNDLHCLSFLNIETLNLNIQKKIALYCMSSKPINKGVEHNSLPGRIIFTLEKPTHTTYLDPLLIQISHFYDLQPPLLCNFSHQEISNMVHAYANISGSDLKNQWNYLEQVVENTKSSWNIHEFMEYIDLQISLINKNNQSVKLVNENTKTQIFKEAVALGKNALKDPALMLELIKNCSSQSQAADLIGVHRSSISRFLKEQNEQLHK